MNVQIDKSARTARLTIHRPPLNVLDIGLLRELDGILTQIESDTSLNIVVLRGAGERAFSAGVDIKDHTPDKVPEMLAVVHGAMKRLLALPQVTIAAVRGVCLGGGCELASCCDMILATDDSVFATPEILVGCYPPVALARFAALVGYHRAAEMILTGRRYTAAEAAQMGLINRVVSARDFDDGLQRLLDELLDKSGAVLRVTLKGLRQLSLAGFSQALEQSEALYCHELLHTQDVAEGVEAFLQKRKPVWSHR
jgi:cyclohexa-1,5-dienecarbonyl-CoA hydratase